MKVDQKITIGSVLVLAHPRFHDGSIAQCRNMLVEILLYAFNGLSRYDAKSRIGFDLRPVAIKRNFQSPVLDVRQNIGPFRMAMMQPRWHAANLEFTTACRNTQEEDFLPGGMNVALQQSRKQFWQPRAT